MKQQPISQSAGLSRTIKAAVLGVSAALAVALGVSLDDLTAAPHRTVSADHQTADTVARRAA